MDEVRGILIEFGFSAQDVEEALKGRLMLTPLRSGGGSSLRAIYKFIDEARKLGLHQVFAGKQNHVVSFEDAKRLSEAVARAGVPNIVMQLSSPGA